MAIVETPVLDPLLAYCHEYNCTDLHMCAGSHPLVRRNAILQMVPETQIITPDVTEEIVRALLPEDKYQVLESQRSLDFSFSRSGLGRFRCNVYSQRGSWAIALRTLPFDIPSLDTLGLPQVVNSFVHKQKGLFLATGATGSGKSTTLASLIDAINTEYAYHIITIEDPVEYLHRHKKSLVTQREVGEDAVSFASALRAALREDPDVIMVGEMRDPETIAIALTAAETGHLVFSTLHTVGAAKSIDRIIDAFPAGQQNQIRTQLAAVLEGVISQQLIPRADGKGLCVAAELMVATPAIRNLIREGKHYQINSVMQTGQAMGMKLLEMDIAQLVHTGRITQEQAVMRSQDPQLLQQFLGRGAAR